MRLRSTGDVASIAAPLVLSTFEQAGYLCGQHRRVSCHHRKTEDRVSIGVGASSGPDPRPGGPGRDLRHRAALCRCEGQGLHRGVPGRLHLRGRAVALHPPGRVRRLRRLRAGVPGRGDLLLGRHPGAVEGLLQGERRVLRGPRLARRRFQARPDPQGPPGDRRPIDAEHRRGPLSVPAGTGGASRVSDRLPRFPWDRLAPYAARADAHPGGRVDLSVGTPVDPVPRGVREALADAANAPGYPATYGTAALREAAAAWMRRELGVPADPAAALPLIGSKELVAGLPSLLGLGPGDAVAYPAPAYPTYEIGALLAGARPIPLSDERLHDDGFWRGDGDAVKLLWLNSPANPHGRVHSAEVLRGVVERARSRGVLVASDECY